MTVKKVHSMKFQPTDSCDEIRQEIMEIENSTRLLQGRLENTESQKGKAVIRGIIKVLEIQRQEKIEELIECENNDLVNLQAYLINVDLDHAGRKIQLSGSIRNLDAMPAEGPVSYVLESTMTFYPETENEQGETKSEIRTLVGEIPAGSKIDPLGTYITEVLELPLKYRSDSQQAQYSFRFIIDPNQKMNDINGEDNVKIMTRTFYNPDLFKGSLPNIFEVER